MVLLTPLSPGGRVLSCTCSKGYAAVLDEIALTPGALECICAVMDAHEGNVDVQRHGCLLLWAIGQYGSHAAVDVLRDSRALSVANRAYRTHHNVIADFSYQMNGGRGPRAFWEALGLPGNYVDPEGSLLSALLTSFGFSNLNNSFSHHPEVPCQVNLVCVARTGAVLGMRTEIRTFNDPDVFETFVWDSFVSPVKQRSTRIQFIWKGNVSFSFCISNTAHEPIALTCLV